MKITDKIIIIDLEATCWKNEVPPKGQESEIIEIGLSVLNTETGEISQNQGILIKPTRSEVSPFCTELTTITQQLLDEQGVSFEEAIEMVADQYDPREYTWASYGQYDLNMLRRQCRNRNIPYPMGEDHINVKTFFTQVRGLARPTGMNGALNILNIPLEGTHHRGVDDANNIAKIMKWCVENY